MANRKLTGLQFDSALAGLANYESSSFFFSVDAHNVAAGAVTRWTTTWPVTNTNAITSVQLNYQNLETVWRPTSGAITLFFGGGTYQVETITYYASGLFHVETYIVNQTGGVVAIPQFYVNVRLFLYNAPF